MTDSELLELYRSDPESAVRVTAEKYHSYVLTIVRDKLSGYSREDIEETVDDVFLRFWREYERVDLRLGSVKAYICLLAKGMAINKRKKLSSRIGSLPLDEAMYTPDEQNTIERQLAHRELLFRLGRLGDTDRRALVMRYFYGMPHAEIAVRLGLKETAVRKRIERALKKLEKEMEGLL